MLNPAVNDVDRHEAETAAGIYKAMVLDIERLKAKLVAHAKDLPKGDEFGCADYLQDMVSDLQGFQLEWEERAALNTVDAQL